MSVKLIKKNKFENCLTNERHSSSLVENGDLLSDL